MNFYLSIYFLSAFSIKLLKEKNKKDLKLRIISIASDSEEFESSDKTENYLKKTNNIDLFVWNEYMSECYDEIIYFLYYESKLSPILSIKFNSLFDENIFELKRLFKTLRSLLCEKSELWFKSKNFLGVITVYQNLKNETFIKNLEFSEFLILFEYLNDFKDYLSELKHVCDEVNQIYCLIYKNSNFQQFSQAIKSFYKFTRYVFPKENVLNSLQEIVYDFNLLKDSLESREYSFKTFEENKKLFTARI